MFLVSHQHGSRECVGAKQTKNNEHETRDSVPDFTLSDRNDSELVPLL